MKTQLYDLLIAPRSLEPNTQNQEVMLNWLLAGSLALSLAAFAATLLHFLVVHDSYLLGRLLIVGGLLGFFGLVLVLSRRYRQCMLSSIIVVATFFLAATLVVFTKDLDNPYAILLFGAAIVIGGLLLGARYSLYLALLTVAVLSIYMYGKVHGYWTPDLSWRSRDSQAIDVAGFTVIYGLVALVSWLLNRQMERARAQQAAQIEQLQQVYRFAELGQLSTALFHDLANHIMSLSLDIEGLQKRRSSDIPARLQDNVRHIHSVIKRVQRQIRGQAGAEQFDVVGEIRATAKTLAYFSNQWQVSIQVGSVPAGQSFRYRGNLTRFRQIIINLLLNALEAYQQAERPLAKRVVTVTVAKRTGALKITVSDRGPGISPAVRARLFEPFYSTKSEGMGIGLFIVKQAVEADFGGQISVTSRQRVGTTFTVTLPLARSRPLQ